MPSQNADKKFGQWNRFEVTVHNTRELSCGRVVARYQGDDISMASILADITHITHPIQSGA